MKKRLFSIFLICCLLCTMLLTVVFATEQTEGPQTSAPASIQSVSYTQTDIEADSVINYGGYGSLRINEAYEDDGWSLKSFPKAALIDSTGSYLFPYKETWLRYRYDDNVVSLTADGAYNGYWLEGQENDMPGYYSINGDTLFTNEYVYASPMMDGYAFVMSGNSWNGLDAYLIDRTGTIVYSFPEGFGESVSAGGGDWSDGFNTENECGWPSEGLIAYGTVLDPCDWNYRHDGYRNMAGEIVFTNNGYDNAYPFYEGIAAVKSAETGLYGFINTSGDEVISCQYEGFSGFCDGYAAAKNDGKWGYINKYGTTVIPFEYDAAYGAGSGLFAVVKDGKCGMVNVENEVVVPLEYDDISSFESGVAYAIKDGEVVIVKPAVSSESDFLFDAETGTITEYKGLGGAVVIPASIGGVSVESIGGGAFSRCESLVNVTIPNGVTSVGDFAFLGCNNLKTAILPEGITRIGEQAFDACDKLTGITIPSTVTSIGKRAFFNCNSLSELTIEEGATSLTYGNPAGHAYGTPSYEWDGTSCTASRVCTKCSAETSGHTQTETVTGRYVKDTDATCTVCEKGHYEASFTNQAFATQSTAKDSVDQGAPLGHSFPETWEKHDETQHKHTCTRCHTEVEHENHAWNDGVITTPATAAAEGVKTFTCTKCGETKTEPVAKLAEQNIWKPSDTITWTYGAQGMTINFTNMSSEGGSLSYSSSNTNVATVTGGLTGCSVNIVGAGETTITATAAAVFGKYVETSVSVKLTINPAPLTVTAKNVSISYGSDASGFDYTVSGLVLGETAANVLSGTPEYQCAYRQYDNVGNYPITVSGLNAANYTISYQPGTLTVEKLADYTMSFVENTLLQSVDHRTPVLATVTPQDSTAQILVEYYAGASWTNTLPTTSGTYSVRASLTASDNLVIPQMPIYIEDSLIIRDGAFIGNKDVMIDVTENQDGSVEIGELTPEQIQAVTNDAATKDKSVTLDLTGNGVASGAQGLTIPASLVDAMNDSSDVESFTVKAKDAEIEMDSSVLNTLAGSLEEGSKLTIQMETVNQENLSTSQKEALESIGGGSDVVVLDLKLVAKQYDEHGTETGSNEIHQLGGIASVQVAYEFEETDGKILVALYVDENGNTTYLPVTYKDGFVSFRTDHFSIYAVTEINKTDCGHSWDEGVVTLEPTTTSTGIRTYTCLICGETKTGTIAKKPGGGNIGGGGGAASAKVQIADGISHGKISADMDSASAGQTVTLTVAPDKGFTLETLTVLDKNGKEVEVKNLGNNKFSFKMPSGNVTIKATFMEDNTMLNFFVDVKATDYYYDAVLWAAENGITKGIDAVHFSPDMDTSRAQVVTFLWRAVGCPEAEHTAAVFKDVSPDAYYVKAVEWALSEGITKGTSDTAFSPDAVCTRGQIVTFLARFAGMKDAETESAFTDVKQTDYFAAAVKWAKNNGVTSGMTPTTFCPNADCTRAQVVTFLYRMITK